MYHGQVDIRRPDAEIVLRFWGFPKILWSCNSNFWYCLVITIQYKSSLLRTKSVMAVLLGIVRDLNASTHLSIPQLPCHLFDDAKQVVMVYLFLKLAVEFLIIIQLWMLWTFNKASISNMQCNGVEKWLNWCKLIIEEAHTRYKKKQCIL